MLPVATANVEIPAFANLVLTVVPIPTPTGAATDKVTAEPT